MSTGQARSSGVRWVLPVVLVVAAVTAAVGMLARDAYHHPTRSPAGDVVSSEGVATVVPRSGRPGDRVVRLSVDAALHPDAERVRVLLQRYVDAINDHSYEQWQRSVTSERVRRMPEPQWAMDYESTLNGGIVVHRIEVSSPDRLRVMMTFVSTQDVAKAPAELQADCIRWRVVYPLQVEGGMLRVDIGAEGAAAQFDPC